MAGRGWARVAADARCLDACARKQLGVRLLRILCDESCVPLATPDTPGAFAFGLRLMAIDGTLEDVNDTPAQYFGCITDDKTRSPYRQLRCIYLVEAGTHAIVKVIAAPCKASEQCLVRGVLPAITPGMLVLVERGFISGALLESMHARGAQVLGRLPQGVFTHKEEVLPDGSYLMRLSPRNCQGLSAPLRVRVIEYRIQPERAEHLEQVTPSRMHSHSGATNPQVRQVHRLITTLLSPEQAPAEARCLCYHERWEVEETINRYSMISVASPNQEGVESIDWEEVCMITDPSAILFICASLMEGVLFFLLKEAHFCLYSLEVTSGCASRGKYSKSLLKDALRTLIDVVSRLA